ncbi:polysaccharide lyase [Sphingomonas sp. BN140010]|uniref:Polysaccharide lyase n=1 Tax=Sphingomonas arvum TaxID=2992113 RepID=A0ABT3JD35_9SPHN|nr:polysaccharide lyase [Sphingomonas sp. BN140010]MCW3796989.1 polysaccharide lyase [Sphingomonas sp. BN140010]
MTRRSCCLAVGAAATGSVGYWAARSTALQPTRMGQGATPYHSTLVNGLTPREIIWNGRQWRCAMGSVWHPGMDHSLRLAAHRARFEIRPDEGDRGPGDPPTKRRSEIRCPQRPRLPNDTPLWGAMSFVHHPWDDPAGMARQWGGVHGQVHIGSEFGGSPALAFRRTGRGSFAITTRGEQDADGTRRFEGPLSFGVVHSLVYRVVLSPTDGALQVWLNGDNLLDLRRVSIGSSDAGCYWSIGCYYAGGVTCPIVAEIGDHFYPSPVDLSSRVRFKPAWRPAA